LAKEVVDQKYAENPVMDAEDIAAAVQYALGTPAHVQVKKFATLNLSISLLRFFSIFFRFMKLQSAQLENF